MIKIPTTLTNAKKILNYIKYDGINTRTAIAQKLGVTKGAVTSAVNELIERGVIVEVGTALNAQAKGRNRVALAINDNYKLCVGVVVENNVINSVISTIDGKVVARSVGQINPLSYHDVLSLIVDATTAIIKDNCVTSNRVLGVGICIGDDVVAMTESASPVTRIKKDLSHALNFRLTVDITANALLIASKVFAPAPIHNGCVAVLRYGKVITSSFMVNCEISPYISGRPDCLLKKQDIDGQTTYAQLIATEDDIVKTEIINSVVDDINTYLAVLAPTKLYLIGDFFDKYEDFIGTMLDKELKHKYKLELLFITEETIGLSGCAIAMDNFFSQYDIIYQNN